MPTTLRDPTARLLTLLPQLLGLPPQEDAPDDPKGSTVNTDRGRGSFRQRRTIESTESRKT
jgi:hypothetical protein